MKSMFAVLFLCLGLLDCSVRRLDDQTFTPVFNAKAVGVRFTLEKGMKQLANSSQTELEVRFKPPFEGPYAVAIIPSNGHLSSDLWKSGLSEDTVKKMEAVLYRFSDRAGPNSIAFDQRGKRVSYTTVPGLLIPSLMTADKEGGLLRLTLSKKQSGLIMLKSME